MEYKNTLINFLNFEFWNWNHLNNLLFFQQFTQDVRKQLKDLLDKKVPSYDWSGITKQTGMFYLTKLTHKQGIDLMKKHHVYMLPSSGRINLGAVTHKNVEKVANALADVVING